MITLFECWNGGTIQWDRENLPQFYFAFPPGNPVVLAFFQLSGRICEVMTRIEWRLNMASQIIDIPNLDVEEINAFVRHVKNTMGYCAMPVPHQLGNPFTGFKTVSITLWVNIPSGRADLYSPFTGPMIGWQLSPPRPGFPSPLSNTDFPMSLTRQGTVEGSGARNLLHFLVKGIGENIGGEILDFCSPALYSGGDSCEL